MSNGQGAVVRWAGRGSDLRTLPVLVEVAASSLADLGVVPGETRVSTLLLEGSGEGQEGEGEGGEDVGDEHGEGVDRERRDERRERRMRVDRKEESEMGDLEAAL
jgi:hypothetical protein